MYHFKCRNKSQLKEVQGFERVFLRSSKTHAERLMDVNFRTILSEIPRGNTFRITGNGRIVKQTEVNDRATVKKSPGSSTFIQDSVVTEQNLP